MKLLAPSFLVLLLLCSCGGQLPDVPKMVTQVVDVPVAAPCQAKDKLGPDPAYKDTDAALLAVPHPDAEARLKANPADQGALSDTFDNLGYQVKLLLGGRLQRIQRETELNAALAACEGVTNGG